MKNIFILSLFYLTSCSPGERSKVTENTESIQYIQTFCFEIVSKKVYESAKKYYSEKLIRDTLIHKKQNGIITLPILSNLKVHNVYEDSIKGLEDEDGREYNYIGQFKNIEYYLISVKYWEHFEVLMIDKNSGNNYSLWAVPSLSPNSKLIASIQSYGLEGAPVGIQIMAIDTNIDKSINKVIEIDQRLWNPLDFVWENDKSIILMVNTIPDFSNQFDVKSEQKFLRLIIS